MRKSDDKRTPRLARALGLIVVLGFPVAAAVPLDRAVPSNSPAVATSDAAEPARSAQAAEQSPQATERPSPAPRSYAAAGAVSANPLVEVRESAPPGADPVLSIVNDPRCGTGFTSVASSRTAPYACVITQPEALPPGTPLASMSKSAAAPPCIGNGVNGPRIQLIYLYVEGQPNRSAVMVPRIINQIVPNMDRTYRETSKAQGREIGMRLHMPGCRLAVDTLMIDEANGSPDDPGAMLNRVTTFISEQGYSTTDRKYIVWLDSGSEGACGVAPVQTAFVPNVTDNAVTGNLANVGWQAALPETALIFRWGMPVLDMPGGAQASECYARGGTGALAEIHELTHLLGAVNLSAPNSNGLNAHCIDANDIMCYSVQGAKAMFARCTSPVELLDCGADDYFNARPTAGSYLSTHWNTANSRFLGEAPVHDAVPLEIPRP